MAVLVAAGYRQAKCVFNSCGHAPAEYKYVHEFTNRPDKYMCKEHAHRVAKALPKTVGFWR